MESEAAQVLRGMERALLAGRQAHGSVGGPDRWQGCQDGYGPWTWGSTR